jgi:uncharacterized OB-fold protein
MPDTTDYKKPIPIPDEASKPFFDGAREHRLMLQKCTSCGSVMWPVKPRCTNCWSADITWVPADGHGTLYSFTLMHQLFHPGFADEMPYNIAEVDLAEGVRIISNVVGCPNSELQIGMPLEVIFEDITDEISLPKFKPVR